MKKIIVTILSLGILLTFFSAAVMAAEGMQILQSIRSAGMGGVAVATPDQNNMLYANPAFLAEVKGLHMTILGLQVGAAEDTISKMQTVSSAMSKTDSKDLSDALSPLVPSILSGSFGLTPISCSFLKDDLGLGAYTNFKFSAEILNKISPKFKVEALGDSALILARAFKINPYFYVAPSLRYNYRGGTYNTADGTNKIELGYMDAFNIAKKQGNSTFSYYMASGMSLDLSALWLVGPGKMGMSWQNLSGSVQGEITTKTSTSDVTAQTSTQNYSGTLPTVITLGYATQALSIVPWNPWNLLSDTTVAMDWRLSSPEQLFYKNIRAGLEKDLWAGRVQLRAGINEGYTTYGLGLNLGIMDIDYAYYLEESSNILGLQPLATQLVSVGIGF